MRFRFNSGERVCLPDAWGKQSRKPVRLSSSINSDIIGAHGSISVSSASSAVASADTSSAVRGEITRSPSSSSRTGPSPWANTASSSPTASWNSSTAAAIDRIAANGLRYGKWHTTALCSPTRSCLLTGRNHTTNGMACISEAAIGFPGANGHIPPECATLAEVLVEQGSSTAMVGKWHLCAEDEMNLASTKRNWPIGRGFERFYGFLGAETNQWYPDLVHDNHPVEQPATPDQGYHFSVDITDKALD